MPTLANLGDRGSRRGRPKHFGPDELRDVWVHMQAIAVITGEPVSKLCSGRHAASFEWWQSGALAPEPENSMGPTVIHRAEGETLRRRYYEAAKFLEAESEPYKWLWDRGYRSSKFEEISPTERFWRRLVEERVHSFRKDRQ